MPPAVKRNRKDGMASTLQREQGEKYTQTDPNTAVGYEQYSIAH